MAFDEHLADRVRAALGRQSIHFIEKRMMGGLCFMVADKMCLGIADRRLMVRLDPAEYDQALRQPGCQPMDFTGRPMRGFVFVEPKGMSTEKRFQRWIGLALEFNPKAKSSKKARLAKKLPKPKSSSDDQTSFKKKNKP